MSTAPTKAEAKRQALAVSGKREVAANVTLAFYQLGCGERGFEERSPVS